MNGSFLAGAPREADKGAQKAHLRRCPRPSSLNVRPKYASLLGMSGALHLDIFDQPIGQRDEGVGTRVQERNGRRQTVDSSQQTAKSPSFPPLVKGEGRGIFNCLTTVALRSIPRTRTVCRVRSAPTGSGAIRIECFSQFRYLNHVAISNKNPAEAETAIHIINNQPYFCTLRFRSSSFSPV
jgi:hypothetical protein